MIVKKLLSAQQAIDIAMQGYHLDDIIEELLDEVDAKIRKQARETKHSATFPYRMRNQSPGDPADFLIWDRLSRILIAKGYTVEIDEPDEVYVKW